MWWSLHTLHEWTRLDSTSTSVCSNSTWDFFSFHHAAQSLPIYVLQSPARCFFFFFFPELAQRKCFRAGRRLTWPAPPHRPSQVPELNLVTFCFCCRKVNCLPFPRCWKPPTLISHSPHGCWAPAAAQNIDRTERISDETSSSRCIRHEGRTPEALLEEDFHNKSPVGERVHQAKPTKSPENVHV